MQNPFPSFARKAVLLVAMVFLAMPVCAAPSKTEVKKIQAALADYFKSYVNPNYTTADKFKVSDVELDKANQSLVIHTNALFAEQPFSPEIVQQIYADVSARLPKPYNTWQLSIKALDFPIEQLVALHRQEGKPLDGRTYAKDFAPVGNPWVTPLDRPNKIERGLNGRHMVVSASHGFYFEAKKNNWRWQRPRLFCTVEDILTPTIVYPYLIPMLENAGAVVYTPRERDMQRNEVLVDNDFPQRNGLYTEIHGSNPWQDAGTGFAHVRDWYFDNQSPFEDGTARMAATQKGDNNQSSIVWQPTIPQEGDYAVYVSYKTVPGSVSDALYTVRHKGVDTHFRVNQQMGGGTWVYLGTFNFGVNDPIDNHVSLSNHSREKGVVTADCVRFGGGMGNVVRSTEGMEFSNPSGMPRFFEGSRYFAQWAGLPYTVYSPFESENDYNDDIRSRPYIANYLARGSEYLPGDSGLHVPVELTLALHTDAGFRPDHTHIGSLGICTTGWNDGITGAGLSRLTSRDFAEIIQDHVMADLSRHFGNWNRRAVYDRNYGESRETLVPGIIFEMLSHQNFWDLCRGHDPHFKFILARAIYKGILQYIALAHNMKPLTVQPLPVEDIAVHIDPINDRAQLSWTPAIDLEDPSATPNAYIVYTQIDNQGYDNGTLVKGKTDLVLNLEPGQMYRFRVAAVNGGGQSLLSEEVCAQSMGNDAPRLLIVNGFQRVAGPQPVDTPEAQGFDIYQDPGVVDNRSAAYCGSQYNFDLASIGKALGDSGSELEGIFVAGNTHNFIAQHAEDICSTLRCNVGSCSAAAIARVPITEYHLADIIMGAQKVDGYSSVAYKTFSQPLRDALLHFTSNGGNVMVSGAYIGSDMQAADEQLFTRSVFKYALAGIQPNDSIQDITGMNTNVYLQGRMNETVYPVAKMDVIVPTDGAFPTMAYLPTNYSAAVAYQGNDYHSIAFGFPLECIVDPQTRRSIFFASTQFLLNK